MYGANQQAVTLHLTQGLRQHLLADAADQFADTREARLAVFRQHFQNQHGPLVGDAADHLSDKRFQTWIDFFRRRLRGVVVRPGNLLFGRWCDLHFFCSPITLFQVTPALDSAYFLKESVVHILGFSGFSGKRNLQIIHRSSSNSNSESGAIMKLKNKTILITGGSSGIGLELTRRLIALGNTVINNAGIMRNLDLNDARHDVVDITREIDINLSGPLRMVQQFLPHLKMQKDAAIVNVSSGLAFIPFVSSPVYSATKAALHSYSQALRVQLRGSSVSVIELAPPGTETPLFREEFKEEVKDMKAMDVKVLAEHAIKGIEAGKLEIRPGLSNVLKLMSRLAPEFMLNQLAKSFRPSGV